MTLLAGAAAALSPDQAALRVLSAAECQAADASTSDILDASLGELLNVEGGFSNHKFDPGSKTRFGITQAVARRWGYEGSMRDLPKDFAVSVYERAYWKPSGADVLAQEWPQLAFELFEFGVNAGVSRAVRALQEVCNAANRDGRDYADISEDGVFGKQTHGAVSEYAEKRGNIGVLEKGVDGRQFDHYFRLSRNDPRRYESFFVGWVDRRIGTDIELSGLS